MKTYTVRIPKEKLLPEAGIVKAPSPNGEQDSMITGCWRVLRSVIDQEKCTKCKTCWIFCPDQSIQVTEEGLMVNLKYCKGCGICADVCPVGAIDRVPELDFDGGVVRLETLF
jgi:pyruvate ferredoxin oxidoreductase delta subunit/oxalate oxidoreductase subunit delta